MSSSDLSNAKFDWCEDVWTTHAFASPARIPAPIPIISTSAKAAPSRTSPEPILCHTQLPSESSAPTPTIPLCAGLIIPMNSPNKAETRMGEKKVRTEASLEMGWDWAGVTSGVRSVASSRSVCSVGSGRTSSAVSSSLIRGRTAGTSLEIKGDRIDLDARSDYAMEGQGVTYRAISTTTRLTRMYTVARSSTSSVVSITRHSRCEKPRLTGETRYRA